MVTTPSLSAWARLTTGEGTSSDFLGNSYSSHDVSTVSSAPLGEGRTNAGHTHIQYGSKVIDQGAKTICVWVNRTGYYNSAGNDKSASAICSSGSQTNTSDKKGLRLEKMYSTHGTLPNDVRAINRRNDSNYPYVTSDAGAAGDNEWIHIAHTLSGTTTSDRAKVYINGELEGDDLLAYSEDTHSYNTYLFRTQDSRYGDTSSGQRYWVGTISDFQVYDRELSQSDIKRIMLGFHPIGG